MPPLTRAINEWNTMLAGRTIFVEKAQSGPGVPRPGSKGTLSAWWCAGVQDGGLPRPFGGPLRPVCCPPRPFGGPLAMIEL